MTAPRREGKGKLDPYQRIMRAAERDTGLRLSADEVYALSKDDAIREAATQDRANEARGGVRRA